ncbi:MAG: 30S ribosomal protein S4 [Candidatus Woesearchaeota archaeon]|nr:30S ribosomal protein S4 [Candidatus Woesearchaeota archaeon]
MGDPRKQRKKYSTPIHPWQKNRIDEEKTLTRIYGLKNKKEIWKMVSKLRSFSKQAKNLIASTTPQGIKEKNQLLSKLYSIGLLPKGADLDDVLSLSTRDIMERRLQTFVYRKNLAKSVKQARQFIVHGHIMVDQKMITWPSYLVKREEEDKIRIVSTSKVAKLLKKEKVIGK